MKFPLIGFSNSDFKVIWYIKERYLNQDHMFEYNIRHATALKLLKRVCRLFRSHNIVKDTPFKKKMLSKRDINEYSRTFT